MARRAVMLAVPMVQPPTNCLDPAILAALAREVYMTVARQWLGKPDYGREPMPRWDGGTDKFGTRHKPIWPKIAKVLLQEAADPWMYMQAQFAAIGREIRPNFLYGKAALRNWEQFKAGTAERVEQQLHNDREAVEAHLLPYTQHGMAFPRALALALGNTTTNSASRLYRYCLAVRNDLPAVAAFFYESALLQYLYQQEPYDAAWGPLLPTPLREFATHTRQSLLGLRA